MHSDERVILDKYQVVSLTKNDSDVNEMLIINAQGKLLILNIIDFHIRLLKALIIYYCMCYNAPSCTFDLDQSE